MTDQGNNGNGGAQPARREFLKPREPTVSEVLAKAVQLDEVQESLDKTLRLLSLADQHVGLLASANKSITAEKDAYMRYAAATTARLDSILGAVESAEHECAEMTKVFGQIENMAREQGERAAVASTMLSSLRITIEAAKAEARDAAVRKPEVVTAPQVTDGPDGGAAAIAEKLKPAQ